MKILIEETCNSSPEYVELDIYHGDTLVKACGGPNPEQCLYRAIGFAEGWCAGQNRIASIEFDLTNKRLFNHNEASDV